MNVKNSNDTAGSVLLCTTTTSTRFNKGKRHKIKHYNAQHQVKNSRSVFPPGIFNTTLTI